MCIRIYGRFVVSYNWFRAETPGESERKSSPVHEDFLRQIVICVVVCVCLLVGRVVVVVVLVDDGGVCLWNRSGRSWHCDMAPGLFKLYARACSEFKQT